MTRRAVVLAVACAIVAGAQVTGDLEAALDRISADSLRGHVSFLASDVLEGRATPSRGLDVAAEYIAAQFRRAGLQPAGDDGYFQTAKWLLLSPEQEGAELSFHAGSESIAIPGEQLRGYATSAVAIKATPVYRIRISKDGALPAISAGDIKDKVAVVTYPPPRDLPFDQRRAVMAFFGRLRRLGAALIVNVRGTQPARTVTRDLLDPSETPELFVNQEVANVDAAGLTLTVRIPEPRGERVTLRNVIGLLPGSDPALKETYILVTAHYDHIGRSAEPQDDPIFNGANDDASGTASIIELAAALSTLKEKPRRSIVFMAFFGEERGLLGARFYARNPRFPLARTVADVNLEHVGRTDSNDGPQINRLFFTGHDYSEVPAAFEEAGRFTGVDVSRNEKYSDTFFARSDNQVFADLGVPAHSATVAFQFPDYHGAGDEWQKLDYDNMARINRTLGAGLVMLANRDQAPKWNASNPSAAKYAQAAESMKPH